MDFLNLCNPFGGSIFTEEYRGDLRQAQEVLLKNQSSLHADVGGRASSVFQQACICMLQGNNKETLQYLTRLGEIPSLSPRWELRHQTYTLLATILRQISKQISHIFSQYITNAGVDDSRTFECIYLLAAINFPGFIRCAQIRHPDYPIGRGGSVYRDMGQQVEAHLQSLQQFQNFCKTTCMQRLGRYITRLEVELLFAIGSPDRLHRLHELEGEYKVSEDWAGVAACKLLEVDFQLASPFSSPLALNLIPVYSGNAGFVNHKWDEFEDKLFLTSSDESDKLLREVYDLFRISDSPRGCAAVRLRQGCVAHMKCYSPDCTVHDRLGFLQAAEEYLSEAHGLFDGDEAHCQIVRGHQTMLLITRQADIKSVTMLAAQIGLWGKEVCSEGISEFVGSLLIRFGRRLLNHLEVDKALMCFEAARECFSSLEEQYGAFQAVVSTIEVHSLTHNDFQARYLIEKQRQSFHDLLDLFTRLGESNPIYNNVFHGTKTNFITSYDLVVSPIYRNLGDYEGLRNWRRQLKELMKIQNTTISILAALDDSFFNYYFGNAARHMFSGLSAPETWIDSVLKLLKRSVSYLLGNKADPKPEPHEDTVSERLQSQHSIIDAYCIASSQYRELVETADIDGAETVLRTLYTSLLSTAPSFSVKMARIFIGRDLGVTDIISEQLYSLTDAELLGNWTMDRYTALRVGRRRRPETSQFRSQTHFDNALGWDRGYRLLQIIETTDPDFFDPGGWRDIDMSHRFISAGLIAGHNGDLEKGFKYLLHALDLIEGFRGNISNVEARRTLISTVPVIDITNGLIFLCLTSRDRRQPLILLSEFGPKYQSAASWEEHVLLFSERSRARSLLDSFGSENVRLTTAEESIIKKYKRAKLRQLRSVAVYDRIKSRTPLVDQQEIETLEKEVGSDDSDLTFEQPILPVNIDIIPTDLYDAIDEDAVVIEILFSYEAVYEVAITRNGVVFAEALNVIPAQFRRSALRLTRAIMESKNLSSHTRRAQFNTINCLLSEISSSIILPVQDLVCSKKHIIFVVSYPMIRFPVGALEFNGMPLCVQKGVSQVPSLSTLVYLSKRCRNTSSWKNTVSSISKVNTWSEYHARPTEPMLPMAGIESIAISHLFDTQPIKASETDREGFRKALSEAQIIHVGTHGVYDGHSPWMMNLLLKEKVRALDLFEFRSNADLIVFSACLSGLGGLVGNESLGFSHVLLEAGCSSYLGALWEVDDIATLLLMFLFFQKIRQCMDDDKVSDVLTEIWRQTLEEFYNLDQFKARKIIHLLIEIWMETADAGRKPNEMVQGGLAYLKRLVKDPTSDNNLQKADGDHPYLYASFMLVGNGSLRLLRRGTPAEIVKDKP
ncbi:CHAT domain-containing protein [Talaromyces proteolyticus]|uniref:CHAT domain-containing protein n=1 Tax=Talaromyces proteolyticus TaxID=1131652 RepID=A0AAD4L2H8_9EURO|nr:CHAT domain-containing protein [Talaromyces proteolyticus]KAH8704768.1 CHAT domain-containing protein [Talaromyces proteolyticus]